MTADRHRVTLLGRTGCHLCDDARATLRRLAGELGFQLVERDVDTDPELTARWSEYLPVVLVDGAVSGWLRVDEAGLRAALAD